MPLLLHPHLKRGLVFDESDTDPADAVEHLPRHHVNPEEQAAKRQRVERVASQYLRGRLPVIMTASLHGPFDHGWKNPWAEETRPKRKSRTSGATRHKAGISGQAGVKRVEREAKSRTGGAARRPPESSEAPRAAITGVDDLQESHTLGAAPRFSRSPEASRAADIGLEGHEESHTLDASQHPPATAPSTREQDTSSGAHFYSAGSTRCVKSRSPMTNPFWLRRPDPKGRSDMRITTSSIVEDSPSLSRAKLPQPDKRRTFQLAQPNTALCHRTPQHSTRSVNDIRSSASASMLISSPVETATSSANNDTGLRVLHPQDTPAATTEPTPSTLGNAQLQSAFTTMPSMTPLADPGIVAAEPPSKPKELHTNITTQEEGQKRLSREIVQRSAEFLVDLLESAPSSTTLSKQTNEDDVRGTKQASDSATLPPRLQHNIVASPAPNSSSGFVYKKVGTRKWTINNAPRSKPRVIHFNSSPANKMDDRREPSSQESKKGDINGRGEVQVAASEAHKEQQSMSSAQSSRQSAMSTQAAMLLAQLEFQESTFPISSLDSPRPWSQPQEETPRPAFLERSPAITPLSVFIPQREQGHAMTSVLRGPVMSTQDLFAAASPFAMSTVKKKPAAPERERSNLRMSITSFAGQDDDADDQPSKSPILCRSRIPLAEKNTAPSPRSFGYDKGPPHSQDSPMEHTGRSFGSVELPELDLGTSLDGYGSSGSFHFAAGILGNFNDS